MKEGAVLVNVVIFGMVFLLAVAVIRRLWR
jgi:hypothetical protein